MPQSLANVLLHVVFSTKDRLPLIRPELREEMFRYLASICRTCDCHAHGVGGTPDHVHLACSLSRTITISKLLEEVKRSSSKWFKTKLPPRSAFAWQNGYGAFSIGQSQLPALKKYIARQAEHHRSRSFQEEFRELLAKYQVTYNEQYVWD